MLNYESYEICTNCGNPICFKGEICRFCKSPNVVVLNKQTYDKYEEFDALPTYAERYEFLKADGFPFDDEMHRKWKKYKDDIARESNAIYDAEQSRIKVECPYCKSTDTKKISGASRWLSTGLFGLSSGKVGKQWHCRKCGSDF